MPSNITIYTSNDNVNYQLLSDEAIAPSNEKYFIKNYEWTGNAMARYIKYVAKVAKQDCWVFTDEIVINKKQGLKAHCYKIKERLFVCIVANGESFFYVRLVHENGVLKSKIPFLKFRLQMK